MKSSEFDSVKDAKAIVSKKLAFYHEMMQRKKDMTTEFDCYGMTPDERAEFDLWFSVWHDPNVGIVETRIKYSAGACAWAACVKTYRERLARQAGALKTFQITNLEVAYGRVTEEMKAAVVHAKREVAEVQAANSILTDEVEKLQIGNDALLARIKELEAENLRAWGEYNNAQAEARNAHTEHLALIGRAVAAVKRAEQLECEIERLRVDEARLEEDWEDPDFYSCAD